MKSTLDGITFELKDFCVIYSPLPSVSLTLRRLNCNQSPYLVVEIEQCTPSLFLALFISFAFVHLPVCRPLASFPSTLPLSPGSCCLLLSPLPPPHSSHSAANKTDEKERAILYRVAQILVQSLICRSPVSV